MAHHYPTRKNFSQTRVYRGQITLHRNKGPTESQKREIKSAIFFLICFVGCLYQMIEVSMQYFSYATVTKLRMFRPEFFYPPAMSICFPYFSLVNFTLAFKRNDVKNYAEKLSKDLNMTIDFTTYRMVQLHPNKFDRKFTAYLVDHFSVAQIMEMTNRIEDWMTKCLVINPEDYVPKLTRNLSECFKVWSIEPYMKYGLKCYEISFKSRNLTKNHQEYPDSDVDYIYNFERLTINFLYERYFWLIELDSTQVGANVEFVSIFLHPYYRKPTGQIDPMIAYKKPGRNHVISISYARYKNILLPKPYKSNCNNYFDSRHHEINECILNNSLAKYNRVPLPAVVSSHQFLQARTFSAAHHRDNLTFYKELENLIFNCYTLLPQRDCVSEIYKPELRYILDGGANFRLEFKLPSDPDFENRFIPKMTFLEYLIYSGSVLGIWFGLSVIRLPLIFSVASVLRWLANILKRRSRPINVPLFQYRF